MKILMSKIHLSYLGVFLIGGLSLACTPSATNTNVNTTLNTNQTSNANSETNAKNSNAETNPDSVAIESEEPKVYQATVSLSIETKGENKTAVPKLQANVARDGENRRMELTAPNGEKLSI